jgi:hypothetical protein
MSESPGLFKNRCYASLLGECAEGISGEHYMSECVEHEIYGLTGTVEVCGLPWLGDDKSHVMPTSNLKAKILCKYHNENLSKTDGEARRLVEGHNLIHANISDGMNTLLQVKGSLIERWMLKTLLGFIASGNMVNQQRRRLLNWNPTRESLEILFKSREFADRCGLYVASNSSRIDDVSRTIVRLRGYYNREFIRVLGLVIKIYEIDYVLVLEDADAMLENLGRVALVHKPRAVCYHDPNCVKTLSFEWQDSICHEAFDIDRLPREGSVAP